MANEVSTWNKILTASLSLSGAQVDRASFLKRELAPYCDEHQLESVVNSCPMQLVSKEVINKIAKSCIHSHALKVTTISAVAGLPGGWAMAATIPVDMAQYYWHILVLAQKLAYLYGYPELCDEKGNFSDAALDILTVFVGVMMGAAIADKAIAKIANELAKQVAVRLPKQALTKTAYYPIIKQVGKWIGVKLTKDSFSKGVSKFIPLIGGLFSGGVTLTAFLPSANRLQGKFEAQMDLLGMRFSESQKQLSGLLDENVYTEFEEVDESCSQTENTSTKTTISEEKLVLMILINMAKIDSNFTEAKRDFMDEAIKTSSLSEDDQLELAQSYNQKETFAIDFSVLKGKDEYTVRLLEKLIELCSLEGKMSLAEKLYLKKTSRELGFAPEDLDEFIQA